MSEDPVPPRDVEKGNRRLLFAFLIFYLVALWFSMTRFRIPGFS